MTLQFIFDNNPIDNRLRQSRQKKLSSQGLPNITLHREAGSTTYRHTFRRLILVIHGQTDIRVLQVNHCALRHQQVTAQSLEDHNLITDGYRQVDKLIGGVGIGAYWGLLGSAGPAKPGSGRLLELRSLSLSRLGPALGQALPVWFGSAWHASA